jgi:hypothetical protein
MDALEVAAWWGRRKGEEMYLESALGIRHHRFWLVGGCKQGSPPSTTSTLVIMDGVAKRGGGRYLKVWDIS